MRLWRDKTKKLTRNALILEHYADDGFMEVIYFKAICQIFLTKLKTLIFETLISIKKPSLSNEKPNFSVYGEAF